MSILVRRGGAWVAVPNAGDRVRTRSGGRWNNTKIGVYVRDNGAWKLTHRASSPLRIGITFMAPGLPGSLRVWQGAGLSIPPRLPSFPSSQNISLPYGRPSAQQLSGRTRVTAVSITSAVDSRGRPWPFIQGYAIRPTGAGPTPLLYGFAWGTRGIIVGGPLRVSTLPGVYQGVVVPTTTSTNPQVLAAATSWLSGGSHPTLRLQVTTPSPPPTSSQGTRPGAILEVTYDQPNITLTVDY